MSIKVKNQHKDIIYVGELSMTVSERKHAVAALSEAIKKAKAKEISLDPEYIRVLEDVQGAIAALRPVDRDKE